MQSSVLCWLVPSVSPPSLPAGRQSRAGPRRTGGCSQKEGKRGVPRLLTQAGGKRVCGPAELGTCNLAGMRVGCVRAAMRVASCGLGAKENKLLAKVKKGG